MLTCTAPTGSRVRSPAAWGAAVAACVCLLAGCSAATAPEDRPGLVPVAGDTAHAGSPSAAAGTDGAAAGAGPASGGSGAAGEPAASDAGGTAHDAGAVVEDAAGVPLDAGTPPAPSVRRLADAPSYRGSVSNGAACDQPYATRGFEPEAPAGSRHPLFLYFTGTNFVLDPEAFRAQIIPAAEAVTEAMARRGFVALQADYDNDPLAWASDHAGLLSCLFGASNPESLLAKACALPQVDCALGIAAWGHSLGALVAHRAADHDPRVRAAWTTGYGGDPGATLPRTRLRVVNGELDTTNGTVAVLNSITGMSAAECPDDGRSQCLRPDGSGWVIVRRADCQRNGADHCWFDKPSCTDATTVLEPNWVEPGSDKPFALAPNADWVAATALAP